MGIDNYIESAMKGILKNPVLTVLREINISKILRQSNFIKRDVGYSPYLVLLHFVYMLVMNKRQSAFIKQSGDAFGKDVYYRFVKNVRYNWRKLLLTSVGALLKKVESLHTKGEPRLFIIDDTVEVKRGRQVEGSCRYLWSNKEHRLVNGLNIVSLNFSDNHSTFQLDFSIRHGESRHKETADFTTPLHHRSNAYKRRTEGTKGKNILALDMVECALAYGINADYLLVDSWYAKPEFIHKSTQLGMPVIARIANNPRIWHFKGKYKSLNTIYGHLSKTRHISFGTHGTIRYRYVDAIVEHHLLGKVKLLFLHTGKELLVFISTDLLLSGEAMIKTYKKRWNIEQGYKDLREYFGLGKEENRIYEAVIARITLSMFTYNLLTYINRIHHEPKTLGELFRDLECELEALVISMQFFLQILTKIAEIDTLVKGNKDLHTIIALLSTYTQKQLGFMCES